MAPTQEVSWWYNPRDPSNDTGLVGRWKFDEGSGQIAYDTSKHGNNGILGNDTVAREDDPSWMGGKFGGSLSFDGRKDYVEVTDDPILDIATEITVEAWINPMTVPFTDWRAFISKDDDAYTFYGVLEQDELMAKLEIAGGIVELYTSEADLEAGKWYHVAFTFDGLNWVIYVNGVVKASTTDYSGVIGTNDSPLNIGRNPKVEQYWDGLIDEVRIYSRALSAEEIMENYLKLQNITKTTYNRYWAESGSNSTYRWDFNTPGLMVSCTFPKGHQILNITYLAGGNWNATLSSDNYTVSSHNSTHQSLTISEASIHQYGYSYRLYTTVSNSISDVRLEVPLLSSPGSYFAPSKEVRIAIRTEDPYGNAFNSPTSGFLFNEEKDVLNKTDGTSSSGWLNYSLTLPSTVGKYWFRANCSGNYAGIRVITFYVSKIRVSISVDDTRINVGSAVTLSGIAKYTVDNSSVPSGIVTVNGTEYPIFSGSYSFIDVKSTVGKWTYKVDSVTDGGGCDAIESNILGYVIWDRIKIVEGGVTDNSTNVGQTVKVWFKAVYEYDGETFDDTKGTLYVGGSDWWVAMTWSPANNRWEYKCTSDTPGMETFEVMMVVDDRYGLTTIIDEAGPQSIRWNEPFIANPLDMTALSATVFAIVAILIVLKKKKHRRPRSFFQMIDGETLISHSKYLLLVAKFLNEKVA